MFQTAKTVLAMATLNVVSSQAYDNVCPKFNGYLGNQSQLPTKNREFVLDEPNVLLSMIETFTDSATVVTGGAAPITGFIATYEVMDPITGRISVATQIIGDVEGGTSMGNTGLPVPVTTFAALLNEKGSIAGLSFSDGNGWETNSPSEIQFAQKVPDPPQQLDSQIIGFSVNSDTDGNKQFQVLTNDCSCSSQSFIRQMDIPNSVTVTWASDAFYWTQFPGHVTEFSQKINCGSHTWRTEPELPFLQIKDINADGSATLQIEATSLEQLGVYQVTLIASQVYPFGNIPEISYPMTITIQCGIDNVLALTDQTSYTYYIGDPGFSMLPVLFEQQPSCGAITTIVPTTPSFVSMTLTIGSAEVILDVAQITDPDLAGEYTVVLDYTAIQMYPMPFVKKSIEIQLLVLNNIDCSQMVIQAPTLSNIVYMLEKDEPIGPMWRLQDSKVVVVNEITTNAKETIFPEFSNTMAEDCPVTYTVQTYPDAPFLDLIEPRTISWAAADTTHVGNYEVLVTATGPSGVSVTTYFVLTIEIATDPCADTILTILSQPMDELYQFYLPSAMDPIEFFVQTFPAPTRCLAAVVFEIAEVTGAPLNSTFFSFDAEKGVLMTPTPLSFLEQPEHYLMVSAKYDGYEETSFTTQTFVVKALTDECVTSTNFFIDPAEYVYTIGAQNQGLNLWRQETNCGPWEVVFDDGQLQGKTSLNPNWQLSLTDITAEDVGTHPVTVTYTLGGITETYLVYVVVQDMGPDCSQQVLVPPTLTDYQHFVQADSGVVVRRLRGGGGDPEPTFQEFPEFSNTMAEDCPVTYTVQTYPDAPFVELVEPRTVQWEAANASHVGSYEVLIVATGPSGVSVTTYFVLSIKIEERPCIDATLEITSASGLKLQDLYLFFLPSAMSPIEFQVTSSQTPDVCEDKLIMELIPLDAQYFQFDANNGILTTPTPSNFLIKPEHALKVVVYYESYNEDTWTEFPFTVKALFDQCQVEQGDTWLDEAEYVYIVGEENPTFDFSIEENPCGTWLYDANFNNLSGNIEAKDWQLELFDITSANVGTYPVFLYYTLGSSVRLIQTVNVLIKEVSLDCSQQVLEPQILDDITYTIPSGTESGILDPTTKEVTTDVTTKTDSTVREVTTVQDFPLRDLQTKATVTSSTTSFEFPEFANSMPEACPVDYIITVKPQASFVEYPGLMSISWANADASHAGSYLVTMTATGPSGVTVSTSFTLTIAVATEIPCADARFTINCTPSEEVFKFYLPGPMDQIAFDVTSSQGPDICQAPIVYELVTPTGDKIDPMYFSYDSQKMTLTTPTPTNFLTQPEHDLKMVAYYEGYVEETYTMLSFKVMALTDLCATTDFKLPDDYVYIVGEQNKALNLWRDSPCGKWGLDVDYGKLSGKITVNPNWQLSLQSITSADVGTFPITVYYSEGDVQETYTVNVTIIAPVVPNCFLIQIGPSNEVLDQIYTVFDPAIAFRFLDFKMTEKCADAPALSYSYKVLRGQTGEEVQGTREFLFFNKDLRMFELKTADMGLIGDYRVVVTVDGIDETQVKVKPLVVNLKIADPCLKTEFLRSSYPEVLSVPEGEELNSFKEELPQDLISFEYSRGQKICGPRTLVLKDANGGTIDPERIILEFQDEDVDGDTFALSLVSDPRGIFTSQTVLMTFTLDDYPGVTAYEHKLLVEYRIASKFDVFEIQPEFDLETLRPSCQNDTSYPLPELLNSQGEKYKFDVSFDALTEEFALFDADKQEIWVYSSKMLDTHEGPHLARVSLTYGGGVYAETLVKELLIEVDCVPETSSIEPTDEEVLVPDPDPEPEVEEPKKEEGKGQVKRRSKKNERGVEIPITEVKVVSDFKIKPIKKWIKKEFNPALPVPKLKKVTEQGLIQIVWDRPMQVPINLDKLEETKYVLMEDELRLSIEKLEQKLGIVRNSDNGRRVLAENYDWFDTNEEYLRYLRIIDALEINIITEYDDGESEDISFSWELKSFETQSIDIQLVFDNPELVSSRNAIDRIQVTFWGTEFFKSETSDEVEYGTTLEAAIVRQVNPENLTKTESALEVSSSGSLGFLSFLLLPLLCVPGESMIPVWLLLVTLQLIAHTPLLLSLMPQGFYIYLRDLLNIMRLKFGSAEASSDGLSLEFNQAGYTSQSLTGNFSSPLSIMLAASTALLVLLIVVDRLLLRSEKHSEKYLKARPYLRPFLALSALAFAYAYLEIALCCLVQIKSSEGSSPMAWLFLIFASLPFVAMPAFFGWNFDQRYVLEEPGTLVTPEEDQSCDDLKREAAANGEKEKDFKEWLENEDLEMANTERKLIADGENAPIKIQLDDPQTFEGGEIEQSPAKAGWEERRVRTLTTKEKAKALIELEERTKSNAFSTEYLAFYGRKIGKSSLSFLALFTLRALLFCIVLVYIQTFTAQVFSALLLCLVYLMVLLHCHKYVWANQAVQALFILNEVTVVVVMTFQLTFSAFVDELETRSLIGLGLVGIINLTILVNIVYSIVKICRYLRLRSRRIANLRKAASLRRQRQKLTKTVDDEKDDIPPAPQSPKGLVSKISAEIMCLSPRALRQVALVTPEPFEQPIDRPSSETSEIEQPQVMSDASSCLKTPPKERELYLLPEEATTQGGDEAPVNIPLHLKDCADNFSLELDTPAPAQERNETPLGNGCKAVEQPMESQAAQILPTVQETQQLTIQGDDVPVSELEDTFNSIEKDVIEVLQNSLDIDLTQREADETPADQATQEQENQLQQPLKEIGNNDVRIAVATGDSIDQLELEASVLLDSVGDYEKSLASTVQEQMNLSQELDGTFDSKKLQDDLGLDQNALPRKQSYVYQPEEEQSKQDTFDKLTKSTKKTNDDHQNKQEFGDYLGCNMELSDQRNVEQMREDAATFENIADFNPATPVVNLKVINSATPDLESTVPDNQDTIDGPKTKKRKFTDRKMTQDVSKPFVQVYGGKAQQQASKWGKNANNKTFNQPAPSDTSSQRSKSSNPGSAVRNGVSRGKSFVEPRKQPKNLFTNAAKRAFETNDQLRVLSKTPYDKKESSPKPRRLFRESSMGSLSSAQEIHVGNYRNSSISSHTNSHYSANSAEKRKRLPNHLLARKSGAKTETRIR